MHTQQPYNHFPDNIPNLPAFSPWSKTYKHHDEIVSSPSVSEDFGIHPSEEHGQTLELFPSPIQRNESMPTIQRNESIVWYFLTDVKCLPYHKTISLAWDDLGTQTINVAFTIKVVNKYSGPCTTLLNDERYISTPHPQSKKYLGTFDP